MKSALKISENPFGSLKMIISRIAHILTGLLNSKRKVWSSESEIL